MSKLIVQVRIVGGGDYQIHYDETNELNIESAIEHLEGKIVENNKTLAHAYSIFKMKLLPEIEDSVKQQIEKCNKAMEQEIERLKKMLMK